MEGGGVSDEKKGVENKSTHSLLVKNLPYLVAITTIVLQVTIKATEYKLPQLPWYPPVSWGLPKEVFIDPIIIFIFAWQGWVVLIPLLVGVVCKSGYRALFSIYLMTAIFIGSAQTFFNFTSF